MFVVWESSQRWPKALGPCTRMEDLEEVPGSWLWIGAVPAAVLTWGVNHQREDLPLCLFSLYIFLSNRKKNFFNL